MEKVYLFFILAVLSSGVLGLSFRNKRQAQELDDLENRYGWNRPSRPHRPGSGQFPQFPGHYPDRFPGQQTNPTAPTTVPTPNVNSSIEDCIRNCPVTPEYNPVCGSNSVTYDNPGRLLCAQACGVSVTHRRSSRCPTPVAS